MRIRDQYQQNLTIVETIINHNFNDRVYGLDHKYGKMNC